jgi:hypothetical protein
MTAPATLLVPKYVWETTLNVFSEYAVAQLEAGCFWYGHRDNDIAIAAVVGIPRQRNYAQSFEIDADDLAALTETACASGLVAVAQLHSHPGCDVRQSWWDDQRVISQNVSSLVLPHYGVSPCALATVGLHRFIQGQWRVLTQSEATAAIQFIPDLVDTRTL